MSGRISLFSPAILIPAGVITAGAGLIVRLQETARAKRYTAETEGEILKVTRSSHYSKNMTRHIYTPTVAYTVDGQRIETNGQGIGVSDFYTEGARIKILYNPKKPGKCLAVPLGHGKRGANITMLIGAGIALIGAAILLIK